LQNKTKTDKIRPEKPMYDWLDEELVKLLQRDARQSSEALGKQLAVSSTTVRRRIRKLVQDGVLRIVAVVDPKKVGFPLIAFITFDVSHDKLEGVMDKLASHQDVIWVSSTTGRFDVLVVARFRSTDELSNFLEKQIPKMEGIRDSETFICLNVKKGRYIRV